MIIFILFILGLSIGSFCNVLIDRIPQGKSFIKGRSRCDRCQHLLSPIDLVPVFSFLILGRKCRYCHKKISWQYPLVEITLGILFILTYLHLINLQTIQASYVLLFYNLFVVSGLLVIFITDFKYRIIPDEILLSLIIVTFVFRLYQFPNLHFANYILSGLFLLGFFLVLFFGTKGKGMGFGDVKYSFFMGLVLGYPNIIIGFYLAFLTGAIISSILLLSGKKGMKSKIAFGPFLTLSTFVTIFYGDKLWLIFKRLLGL